MQSTHHHGMSDLFDQLGLPSGSTAMRRFIDSHRPLPKEVALSDADFWSDSQSAFLRQMLKEDSDWAVPIDQLSAALHEHPTPSDLPSVDEDPEMQGEGNYVAGKRYDDAVTKFAQSGKVEAAARAAAPKSKEEAHEMWEAEAVGLSKAKN